MAKNRKAADKAAAKKKSTALMDRPHAELIVQAEVHIKAAEAKLEVCMARRKEAKEALDHAIDRLRKLAEEITEKDLFAEKNRK